MSYKRKSWVKFISNKYVLVTLFFIVWMLFLDNYSVWNQRALNSEIDEMEATKKYLQDEIRKDNKSIKLFKNPDQIEKYAREKYFMKRDSEDIYIIEYEGEVKDTSNKMMPN